MKIYVATRFTARTGLARRVAEQLMAMGHEVTSRWILEEDHVKHSRMENALVDLEDVDRADALLYLTEPWINWSPTPGDPRGWGRGGGMWLETGYALKAGKMVFRMGEAVTVFCHHPKVQLITELSEIHI